MRPVTAHHQSYCHRRGEPGLLGQTIPERLVDEFPLTVTGKLKKLRMREITVAEMPPDPADQAPRPKK